MVWVNTPFTYRSIESPSIVTATSCHCVGCCARTPYPLEANTAISAKSAERSRNLNIGRLTPNRRAYGETNDALCFF